MPTSYVRLIVVGLTFVLAVFTGLVTGFVAGGPGCDEVTPAPASNNISTPPPSTVTPGNPVPGEASGPAAPNNNPSQAGATTTTGDLPGLNESLTDTALFAADNCSGFSALTAVFGFLGSLFTGAVIGGVALFLPRPEPAAVVDPNHAALAAARAVGHNRASTATGSHPVVVDPGSTGVSPDTKRLATERKTLVETCIYVRDRATSKAIGDRLAWALSEVGVVEDRPTGESFDTARHEAGGTAPTEDRQMEGKIAAVEISGYTDRGHVVRAPVVTVFQATVR